MLASKKNLKSTIIVSVYTDHVALNIILECLSKQTCDNFEIIISEDGQSHEIVECIRNFEHSNMAISHLSQEDKGFRKNIALNRAIKSSNTDHIIFIDGDCIPHPSFVEAHQLYARPGIACTGRRLELGEKISTKIRNKEISLSRLTNRALYLLNIISLVSDKAKNIESGIYSKTLQFITKDNETRLLGCNFSCSKQDLLKINGFNEEYLAAGTGEDSDIDWRLLKSGVTIKKVKFSAIQYHLYHPRTYGISETNIELLNSTISSNSYRCRHGLEKLPDYNP